MGPLRGRLTLTAFALAPSPLWAAVCDQVRPNWTPGTEVGLIEETLLLFASPVSLLLLLGMALAIRLRHQWGALAVVVGWTAWISVIAVGNSQVQAAARAEGCMGSPALFISLGAAICIATILFTRPRPVRD